MTVNEKLASLYPDVRKCVDISVIRAGESLSRIPYEV
jgi:hypothetical protein